jgi:hypothetical protein
MGRGKRNRAGPARTSRGPRRTARGGRVAGASLRRAKRRQGVSGRTGFDLAGQGRRRRDPEGRRRSVAVEVSVIACHCSRTRAASARNGKSAVVRFNAASRFFAVVWRFSIGGRAFNHSPRVISPAAHISASSSSCACVRSTSACQSSAFASVDGFAIASLSLGDSSRCRTASTTNASTGSATTVTLPHPPKPGPLAHTYRRDPSARGRAYSCVPQCEQRSNRVSR